MQVRGPLHMRQGIPYDGIAVDEEQRMGSQFGAYLHGITQVDHAHVPEGVVSQEQENVDVRQHHLLAYSVPATVAFLERELRYVLAQLLRRPRAFGQGMRREGRISSHGVLDKRQSTSIDRIALHAPRFFLLNTFHGPCGNGMRSISRL